MFYRVKSSIAAKFLVTFLLVLIIPLLLLTWLFVARLHTVLKNKESAFIKEKISYAENQFDRIFSDMDRIATSLILDYRVTDILTDPAAAPSYEWFEDYKSLNALLGLLNSNADYAYNITVLSHDDRLFHSGAAYNTMLKTDSPIISAVMEGNGNPVIFNRSLDGYDDTQVVTLGRSVFQKGRYLGSILVEVPISCLDNLFSPFESTSTLLYVLEKNSRILYASAAVDASNVPAALQEALTRQDTSVRLHDTTYLLQQMPTNQRSLSVVTLVTTDSVFRESSRVIFYFVLAFFLIIVAAILGIFLMTFTFTRDIRALNAAVSRFGNDTAEKLELPVRSSDEVGQLTEGVISMSHRILRLLRQIQENERSKRILEFNALQAQINPHMIYNTLNTITYLAEVQNVRNIKEISSSFAYLLRSLSNQGEFITISQEMEYLRSFISVKKYNLLCSIQTDFQVAEAAADCLILKLILQPIVENAMIHGFSNRLEDGLLSIRVRLTEDMLCIDVSDDGNGMDEECIRKTLSGDQKSGNTFLRIGIKNIVDRLCLQYGSRYSFSIDSAPGCGTTVHLTFPAEWAPHSTEAKNSDTERKMT